MPGKTQSSGSGLAERLLVELEAQRGLGKEAYPLQLQHLVHLTDPQATPDLVQKALSAKSFKSRTLLIGKSQSTCLVALSEDTEKLDAFPQLLEFALETLCTSAEPLWPLVDVKGAIKNKQQQKLFGDAVTRLIHDKTLPPTVGCRLEGKKQLLYLNHIPPPLSLAGSLLAVLEAQCRLGGEAYPLTLQRLVQLTDPQALPNVVKDALDDKLFKSRAILIGKDRLARLVALSEDTEQLAGNPRLLEFALESLCSSAKPLCTLTDVKSAINNKKLEKAFGDAVTKQINENTLPPTVGCRSEAKKQLLYLTRIPPPAPPPPPKKAEARLAESLLVVLDAQRRLGGEAYPLSLKRLIELTNPEADSKLVNKALAHETLRDRLVRVDPKKEAAPLAFVEDKAQLLSSHLAWEFLLRAKCKPDAKAFAIDSLLTKKSDLREPFLEAANRLIEEGSLPPKIGWMWVGKKKQVFFLEDVHSNRQRKERSNGPSPTPSRAQTGASTAPPADFGRAFDEAFHQIDRQDGAHNFVSLVELRRRLPLDPQAFDAELRKLRIAGRYTLSAAEGRHGVSPEERAAGIVEDGSLLLYVSRKIP